MLKSILGAVVLMLVLAGIYIPSYAKFQDSKQKNLEYKAEIERLVKKTEELKLEKKRLEEDPVYLEKIAREKLGLIKEGEVMYKIRPAPPTANKKSSKIQTQAALKKSAPVVSKVLH